MALGVPVLGGFEDVDFALRVTSADAVAVLPCPEMDGPALRMLSWSLAKSGIDLLVAPALIDVAGPRIAIRPVCGLPLLHVDEPQLAGGRRVAKALLDRLRGADRADRSRAAAGGDRAGHPAQQPRAGDLPADPDRVAGARVHDVEVPHDGPQRRGAAVQS